MTETTTFNPDGCDVCREWLAYCPDCLRAFYKDVDRRILAEEWLEADKDGGPSGTLAFNPDADVD